MHTSQGPTHFTRRCDCKCDCACLRCAFSRNSALLPSQECSCAQPIRASALNASHSGTFHRIEYCILFVIVSSDTHGSASISPGCTPTRFGGDLRRNILCPRNFVYEAQCIVQEYVLGRIRQFSQVFAHIIAPEVSTPQVEAAVRDAYAACTGANQAQEEAPGQQQETFQLKFAHRCRFLGCLNKQCTLCINNPNKRCPADDNFSDAFADNQALKSKCDMDIFVQLVSLSSGSPVNVPGMEIQVSSAGTRGDIPCSAWTRS